MTIRLQPKEYRSAHLAVLLTTWLYAMLISVPKLIQYRQSISSAIYPSSLYQTLQLVLKIHDSIVTILCL